jgi:hypothetical protein
VNLEFPPLITSGVLLLCGHNHRQAHQPAHGDVDWQNNTVSFFRKKTGVPVLVHLGAEALNLFKAKTQLKS